MSSLHIEPTSSNTVDVDIAEEGFKVFDSYKVEYTTADRLDKWKQVRSSICRWVRQKKIFLGIGHHSWWSTFNNR